MELNKLHELHSAVLYLYVMMAYDQLIRNYLSAGSVYDMDQLLPFENPFSVLYMAFCLLYCTSSLKWMQI